MKTLSFSILALALVACGGETAEPVKSTSDGPLAAFHASNVPSGAVGVLETRKSAAPGAEVTVVGRAKDFVGGRAAFTLIDSSLRACSDAGDPMGESCETPWDYCCIEPREVTRASATVEFRDDAGVIKAPVQGFAGLDHLDTVYVQGVLEKDEQGNLTIVARSFHSQPNER